MRRSKYGNRRASADGYTFDSQAELARYEELRLLVRAGVISDLEVHPRFELQPAFTDRDGTRHRAIVYEADFAYTEGGKRIAEDVKGAETDVFRLKKRLFLYTHRDIEFRVLKVRR